MSHILVLYSTTDGHTRLICERLNERLQRSGHMVTLVDIRDDPDIDAEGFDKIVVGASIRYGRHSPLIAAFIKKHHGTVERKPNAFFSVNLVARKPDKNRPETNPYLQRFLRRIPWKPQNLAVFAGKLDYPSYRLLDRLLIRLIMAVTGGPTDPSAVVEFTNWEDVDDFGRLIGEM